MSDQPGNSPCEPCEPLPCDQPVVACTPAAVQPICVTAEITIIPTVTCKKSTITCVGPPRIVRPPQKPCPEGTRSPDGTCRTTISQVLRVKVPVEFGAVVDCRKGDVFCLPPGSDHKQAAPPPPPRSNFLYTRSATFFQEELFPANFTDGELCRATQTICAHSVCLADLLSGFGCVTSEDSLPAILPLSCLNRLEALLTPATAVAIVQERSPGASPILGQATRQLLAVLLNVSLSATTPLGLVGGLSLDCPIDLRRFPKAVALLGNASTVGALVAAVDAALFGLDVSKAEALEPVLEAVNTEETPSIMIRRP